MQKTNNTSMTGIYIVAVILGYITLNQGGYFAGGIISTGLIASLFLFGKKPELKMFDIFLLAFSIWYLFCSLIGGFDIRYAAKGLIPLLCLMFRMLIPRYTVDAKALCQKIIKVSFYIAVLAIVLCIYKSFKSERLLRLKFPFQYANASGIFFGVMFILARYCEFSWAKKRQYIFFLGLILTQSVGSIGVTVIAEICLSKNLKRTLMILGVLIVGAVFLKGRVYQSIGTFIERFLQMHDGIRCVADNPFFGIGAGRWELFKNIYQTGFYQAKEMHSSIVEIAVASGSVGILLFISSIVVLLKTFHFENKAYLTGILMFIGHSCLDFTLSFLAFGFIIMVLISCGEDKKQEVIIFNKPSAIACACVMTSVFFVLSIGMYQMNRLDSLDLSKKYSQYTKYYENNPLSRLSVGTKEKYAKALYATGDKEGCENQLENIGVLSTDMIILKKGCSNEWRVAFDYLKTQPYNSVLYRTVFYNSNDKKLQNETKEMLDENIKSMSFLGKILFNFKGEKVL